MHEKSVFENLGITPLEEHPIDGFNKLPHLVKYWKDENFPICEENRVYVLTPSNTWIGGATGASHFQIVRIRGKLYKVSHNTVWYTKIGGIVSEGYEDYVSFEYGKQTSECKSLEKDLGGYLKRM